MTTLPTGGWSTGQLAEFLLSGLIYEPGAAGNTAGSGPKEATLVGVIPEWIATGVALSPQLEAAVGRAVLAVVDELEKLGVHPVRRRHPQAPDLWWAAEERPLIR